MAVWIKCWSKCSVDTVARAAIERSRIFRGYRDLADRATMLLGNS